MHTLLYMTFYCACIFSSLSNNSLRCFPILVVWICLSAFYPLSVQILMNSVLLFCFVLRH
nr:hypothetical protein Q903MT_gene4946 [Picea sitchensis]